MSTGNENADYGMPKGIDYSKGNIKKKTNSETNVSSPSIRYNLMAPKWKLIDTLLGGTKSMRDARENYLPRHPYESSDAYNERIDTATLKNYTSRTLENLTSKAFRDPPTINSDVPSQIVSILDDIDYEGNNFVVFAREWFKTAVQRAFAFVLVDHTKVTVNEGQIRTLEDDRREKVRPFWRLIDPVDVLDMVTTRNHLGINEITEVRIREVEVINNGDWTTSYVQRIRVINKGWYRLFQKTEDNRGKENWLLIEDGPVDLPYIPIVPFYTSKISTMLGKPPLEDLAYLNVEHFQSSSDQRAILTVARFPILAVSGANTADANADPLQIGPKKWLSIADPQGRIYYVEHEGKAIEAGRTDLEDLEDQMASYGSEFLRKRPGASSATGRALDSAEAISPLMAWGMDFKDALEQALSITADWMNLENGGTVSYQIKPDVSVGESKELDALDRARERKDISRKAFLHELKRRDILAPEYDIEKDEEEISKEPEVEASDFSAIIKSSSPKKPSLSGKPGKTRQSDEPPLNSD